MRVLCCALVCCGAQAFMAPASRVALKTRPFTVTNVASRMRSVPVVALGASVEEEQEEQETEDEQQYLSEDQQLIARLDAEIMEEQGVPLDQLLNPGKVVNLERELAQLRIDLQGAAGNAALEIQASIEEKEAKAAMEKRSVVRGWLKNLFVGQSVLATVIAGIMVYDKVPGFEHVDLSVRVLGFWLIWLFTIPSLRARKPGAEEKTALNIAFVATPLANLILPFATKDPVTLYWANLAICAACYAYGFTVGAGEPSEEDARELPDWLKFAAKALDFGSGQERGARK
ncbi:unnamed protein product [Chrysoparadoxa australica]